MDKSDEKKLKDENEKLSTEGLNPLVIFRTEADIYGTDIAAMSNFFDGYVDEMALTLTKSSELEIVSDYPIGNIGIINDVINQVDIVMQGKVTLLPDFNNLPVDVKSKLKKGLYSVGESKQVDGNLRSVILDENGVRVKDITLKKVVNNQGNIETVRSIGNQMQMRQIYAKLADIQEFQTYQLEKDRDRDMVVPFLDARSLILESETKESEVEKIQMLKQADDKIRTALNAIYADIATTSKSFANRANSPFWHYGNQINRYIRYLSSDLQFATKYVGARMQLLEHINEKKTAQTVLAQYYHVMSDFLSKPITKKGLATVSLMHDYYPYSKNNMNCWYKMSKELKPLIDLSIATLKIDTNEYSENEVYVVSLEDVEDE